MIAKPVLCTLLLFGLILSPAPPALAESGGESDASMAPVRLKYATFTPGVDEPAMPAGLSAASSDTVRLVRVAGPLTSPQIKALEQAGAELLGYIPEHTYLARVPGDRLDAVRTLPTVTWIGPYHAAYKIQEELLKATAAEVEVNVVYFPEVAGTTGSSGLKSAAGALGARVTAHEDGYPLVRMRISPSALPALATRSEVRWIDRWAPPVAQMDKIRNITGATFASLDGFDGTGIVGEVKDNGIDQGHPDFSNLIGTYGGPVTDSHGTCTFGIVFGDGNESTNATGMMPAAGGVFCDWYVGRSSSISNLKNSWGGVFQSNSWSSGYSDSDYDSTSRENDEATVDNDVLMFYSASNSNYGVGSETCSSDSVAKNVVCVGAVFHQNTETLSDDQWENHGSGSTPGQGPARDGRIKPDVIAFFDSIYTTDVRGGGGYSGGDYYSDFGGTSGSCPIVAGAAGLTYQMYEENHFGNNPSGVTPKPSTIKALLIANAYQYPLDRANRYRQGWGLSDVGRIHEAAHNQLIVDADVPLSTGQSWSADVSRFNGSESLKISLVWSDEPGEASSSKALINDLDLKVTAPDGTIYRGNIGLVDNLWSTEGGAWDRLNNVENVFVQSPVDGTWTIEVIADNVAMDNDDAAGVNQAFSLVATMVGNGGTPTMATIVTGPGAGPTNPPLVRTFDPATTDMVSQWDGYGAVGYGVNVAVGNLGSGGVVITGPGPGAIYGPHVRAFSADGTPVAGVNFQAYGTSKYGVNVAAGDIDNDGNDEIITGAGPGNVFGPHVRAWNVDGGTAASISGLSYFAYGTLQWGVNVACGDLDGDGYDEIVTGAGPGTVFGPHVRGWNVDGGSSATPLGGVSYFAYSTLQYGVNVACGDIDGDGMDEIVTGAGPGNIFGPHVRGWNIDGSAAAPMSGVSFFAYNSGYFGVAVGAADLDGDGRDEILTMPGSDPSRGTRIRAWDVDSGTVTLMPGMDFPAYEDMGLNYGGKISGGAI